MTALLPIYDTRGTLIGFTQTRTRLGYPIKNARSSLRVGMVLRVESLGDDNVLFEVLHAGDP